MKNRELIKRLHYVKGQLDGIEKMLRDERPPQEIYVQLRSVESAVHKSILQTFEMQYRQALIQTIVYALETCQNRNPCCDKVEALKRTVPRMDMMEVLKCLREFKEEEEKQCVS